MVVNSKEMTISLPQKKLQSIKQTCQVCIRIHRQVLESTKVLGQLTSTVLVIFPAKLHCRFLQQQQIQALKKMVLTKVKCYLTKNLNWSSLVDEKHRNIQRKDLFNFSPSSSFTDASLTGWGSIGRSENWWDMDSEGEKDAHKRTVTSCIETSSENLFETIGNRVTA